MSRRDSVATESNDMAEEGFVEVVADTGAATTLDDVPEILPGDGVAALPSPTWVSKFSCPRLLTYGLLPALVLVLALAAGYLKWLDASAGGEQAISVESVYAATQGTVALLSYRPDTVEKDLGAARDLLTGDFKDSYTALTHDVVIPASKETKISAVATVAAAASVSATENHAVVLVFVNQRVTIGTDAPTDTASTVRVTLDRVDGRWLVGAFDPI